MSVVSDSASESPSSLRQRRRSPDRIAEIIGLAEAQIRDTGMLPLSMNAISEAMGASRALVYAYFSDSDKLVEAVLAAHFDRLFATGLQEAAAAGSVVERGIACSQIYLRHVATHGNVIHNILREVPRTVRLSPGATQRRNRLLRTLVRAARRQIGITVTEATVLIELLAAIPEEIGRMERKGELSREQGEAICRRLVQSGIESLQPTR